MSHRGHAQPRIAEAHLRKLSSLATRYGMSMTHLLNLIVATALEELEQAADVCDEGKTAHTPSRAHDRHRLPRAVAVRHRH